MIVECLWDCWTELSGRAKLASLSNVIHLKQTIFFWFDFNTWREDIFCFCVQLKVTLINILIFVWREIIANFNLIINFCQVLNQWEALTQQEGRITASLPRAFFFVISGTVGGHDYLRKHLHKVETSEDMTTFDSCSALQSRWWLLGQVCPNY